MNLSASRRLRAVAAMVALGSPVISHLALAMGQGYGVAAVLAALQAVATGTLAWTSLGSRRWLGPLATLLLLGALVAGAGDGLANGLLAMAGTGHAMLYGVLLVVFGNTLRPGHVALATWLASRLNPTFHAGMVPYTRKVTAAWTAFFAAQLVVSAILLGTDPALWQSFVTVLHIPAAVLMAAGEALVRRWRWRHEHATGFMETVRGTRRLMRRGPLSVEPAESVLGISRRSDPWRL